MNPPVDNAVYEIDLASHTYDRTVDSNLTYSLYVASVTRNGASVAPVPLAGGGHYIPLFTRDHGIGVSALYWRSEWSLDMSVDTNGYDGGDAVQDIFIAADFGPEIDTTYPTPDSASFSLSATVDFTVPAFFGVGFPDIVRYPYFFTLYPYLQVGAVPDWVGTISGGHSTVTYLGYDGMLTQPAWGVGRAVG